MDTRKAYDEWAGSYNEVVNHTRDMELKAKKAVLEPIQFSKVLELGCGTGKNTAWLSQKAATVLSVDFSENMLAKAKQSVSSPNVQFVQADITQPWKFVKEPFDLITCSLVLEHIEDLQPVFEKAFAALTTNGHFYIGELHPFKQYAGSKARFQKNEETVMLDCYTHHISSFTSAATANGFSIMEVNEYFDNDSAEGIPRIITCLFKKNK